MSAKKGRACALPFFIWRKRWDSNPCALADNRISSAARYDHFDTLPNIMTRFSITYILKVRNTLKYVIIINGGKS